MADPESNPVFGLWKFERDFAPRFKTPVIEA
jgi:hypothetical protein